MKKKIHEIKLKIQEELILHGNSDDAAKLSEAFGKIWLLVTEQSWFQIFSKMRGAILKNE